MSMSIPDLHKAILREFRHANTPEAERLLTELSSRAADLEHYLDMDKSYDEDSKAGRFQASDNLPD